MNRVVLDTDIFSELLKQRDANVVQHGKLYLETNERLTVTAVTVLEVIAGWHHRSREDRVQEFLAQLSHLEVLPFETKAAEKAGRIEADLRKLGRTIGRADSIIAAIALVSGLPLVTGNTSHYARIRELGWPLELKNWRIQPTDEPAS